MDDLADRVWLWGQTPGTHHRVERFNLPGVNRMTPIQGCEFFGIRNHPSTQSLRE
jgi:hypothetical protein